MDYVCLDILTKHLGQPTKKKDENYAFFCPFCNHRKQKLEVDLSGEEGSGRWNCWTCPERGKSVYSLLKKINAPGSDLDLVKKFKAQPVNEIDNLFKDLKLKTNYLSLPQYYTPLRGDVSKKEETNFLNYLKKRGLSLEDVKRYKIGYLREGSKKNNLVLPSFDSKGYLNYYILKDIVSGDYTNPPHSRDIISLDFFINWNEPVVLVEGMFDAYAVKHNAVPLLGLTLQPKLKEKLVSSLTKDFYVCLDAGEDMAISNVINYITGIGKNAYKVILPHTVDTSGKTNSEDPSSLGHFKVWEYIKQAEKVEQTDIFLYNLMSKW